MRDDSCDEERFYWSKKVRQKFASASLRLTRLAATSQLL
jgi:hypothetical protein